MQPHVEAFFDPVTFTYSYVVVDPASQKCALIDPVLDFDPASGRTHHESAQKLLDFVQAQGLSVEWILETHVHADHLSAAQWLKAQLGGRLAIGAQVVQVQKTFAALFHAEPSFASDGSQFEHLFQDNELFQVGEIQARVLFTPGHTPACVSYVIGDAVFVGDTLFMPDYGTARCDFPGGDARTLYQSVQRLFALPEDTRVFMCHDYKAPGRETFAYQSSVAEQKQHNVHLHQGVSEADFVALRSARDATLKMPALILPSVQINMRSGQLPPAEENGVSYLKIPLNVL